MDQVDRALLPPPPPPPSLPPPFFLTRFARNSHIRLNADFVNVVILRRLVCCNRYHQRRPILEPRYGLHETFTISTLPDDLGTAILLQRRGEDFRRAAQGFGFGVQGSGL